MIHSESWYKEADDKDLSLLLKGIERRDPGAEEEWVKQVLRRTVPPPGLSGYLKHTLLVHHPLLTSTYVEVRSTGTALYPEWLWPFYLRWLTSKKPTPTDVQNILSVCPEEYLPEITFRHTYFARDFVIGDRGYDIQNNRGRFALDGSPLIHRGLDSLAYSTNTTDLKDFLEQAKLSLGGELRFRKERKGIPARGKWEPTSTTWEWSLVVFHAYPFDGAYRRVLPQGEIEDYLQYEMWDTGQFRTEYVPGTILEEEYHFLEVDEFSIPGYYKSGMDNLVMSNWEPALLEVVRQ